MINIVLINPEIPQNTGNIARTCVGFGARLHLIRPYGFILNDKKMLRSGLDYWQHLELFEYVDWDDFIAKNQLCVDTDFLFFSKKSKFLLNDFEIKPEKKNMFLIFGPETKGISNEILSKYNEKTIRIETTEKIRSLNLSNSVAIACFEVDRQFRIQNF